MTPETVENGKRAPDANQEVLAFREVKYGGFRIRHRVYPPVVTYWFFSPWGDFEFNVSGGKVEE